MTKAIETAKEFNKELLKDIYVDEKDLEAAQRIYQEVLSFEPQFDDEDFEEE